MMYGDYLGAVLYLARRQRNKTLRQISRTSNVSLGYISEVEQAKKSPSDQVVESLAIALGTKSWVLYKEAARLMEEGSRVPEALMQTRQDREIVIVP